MTKKLRKPDFHVKTPCAGPQGGEWPSKPRWRVIGEGFTDGDTITCRVDLPVQNCRIILVPFEGKASGGSSEDDSE